MWPQKIINLFAAVDFSSKDEFLLYGPFNALLDYCFPWENDWNVVPQYRQPKRKETIDFTTIFLIEKNTFPVFFVEIKPLDHINNISTRSNADEQMRDRFISLLPDIHIETLHGMSAMGNKLSHYRLNTNTKELEPIMIQRDLYVINDTAPASRWNIDILNESGYNKFMEIVDDIKSMSSSLR